MWVNNAHTSSTRHSQPRAGALTAVGTGKSWATKRSESNKCTGSETWVPPSKATSASTSSTTQPIGCTIGVSMDETNREHDTQSQSANHNRKKKEGSPLVEVYRWQQHQYREQPSATMGGGQTPCTSCSTDSTKRSLRGVGERGSVQNHIVTHLCWAFKGSPLLLQSCVLQAA